MGEKHTPGKIQRYHFYKYERDMDTDPEGDWVEWEVVEEMAELLKECHDLLNPDIYVSEKGREKMAAMKRILEFLKRIEGA